MRKPTEPCLQCEAESGKWNTPGGPRCVRCGQRILSQYPANQLKKWAEKIPIHWRKGSPKDAQTAITESYFAYKKKYGWTDTPLTETPKHVLHRWAVNYLRHEFLQYHEKISKVQGKTGEDAARQEIKRRCLAMIAEQYPELAEECERQAGEYD